jgi:hypothetical protein
MRVRLGINTCFAVKRWPRPVDWATLVRDDLGLDLVELSLDLLEGIETAEGRRRVAHENRAALEAAGLTAVGTFTGLVAYSRNLLLHPDPIARREALRWYETVVDLSAALGVSGVGGHVGALSAPDWRDPSVVAERWAGLKADLATLSARARRVGLEYFLIENLVPVREPATMAQVASLLTPGDRDHVPVGRAARGPAPAIRRRGRSPVAIHRGTQPPGANRSGPGPRHAGRVRRGRGDPDPRDDPELGAARR